MNIAIVTKNDVPHCATAFVDAYNAMPWNHKWTPQGATTYLQEYTDNPHFVGFMICEDDEVCGALFGHTKTWWTGKQFMIDELFINAKKQGKGYGKLLLKQTEEYCKQNQASVITLMTNKYMPALEFYNRNNFNKVEQYVFMFKQNNP